MMSRIHRCPYDAEFDIAIEPKDEVRAVFFGLGADGTVGANKNSIKIIGEETDLYAQGYFVYDSKKSGAVTISHLRFGPNPIRSPYLFKQADFVACHQWPFLERYNVVDYATEGATLLLNSPYGPDEVWDHLSVETQREIIARKLKCYVIDAYPVAKASGMGGRINTIMQTCFFAISNVLPREEAIAQIKKTIRKTYCQKGRVRRADKISRRWTKRWPPCTKSRFPQAVHGQGTSTADCSGGSARFCPARHGDHAGQQGRLAAGQRLPGGWHLADRHDALGKARHRTGNSGLGLRDLHSMQQVRAGLPARGHPGQVLSRRPAFAGAPAQFKSTAFRSQEWKDHSLFAAGVAGRLHRLHLVRGGMPGEIEDRSETQGDQHGADAPVARAGEGQLRVLPQSALARPDQAGDGCQRQRNSASRSSSIPAPAPAAAKRLTSNCSRKCPATGCSSTNATGCSSIYGGNLPDHALHRQQRPARPGLVQFALRGQRGIWLRPPHRAGQTNRVRPRTGEETGAATGRADWRMHCSPPNRTTRRG